MVTCTHGMCAVQIHNKMKIPKSAKVENFKGFCPYVKTIVTHKDSVKSYFPEYSKSDVKMSEENHPDEENEQDSELLDHNIEGNFDVETGLWNFPSLTKFKPKDMMGPQLIKYTKKRIITTLEEDCGVELKPDAYKNNTLRMCDCGAGYSLETDYTLKRHSTLYTRMGHVRCSFSTCYCNGTCELKFEEVAEEQGIFFSFKSLVWVMKLAGTLSGMFLLKEHLSKHTVRT